MTPCRGCGRLIETDATMCPACLAAERREHQRAKAKARAIALAERLRRTS